MERNIWSHFDTVIKHKSIIQHVMLMQLLAKRSWFRKARVMLYIHIIVWDFCGVWDFVNGPTLFEHGCLFTADVIFTVLRQVNKAVSFAPSSPPLFSCFIFVHSYTSDLCFPDVCHAHGLRSNTLLLHSLEIFGVMFAGFQA